MIYDYRDNGMDIVLRRSFAAPSPSKTLDPHHIITNITHIFTGCVVAQRYDHEIYTGGRSPANVFCYHNEVYITDEIHVYDNDTVGRSGASMDALSFNTEDL
jgi:hypothetical protein